MADDIDLTATRGRMPGPAVLAIVGTGQNGATLLSRMLGEVPGVVAVGELGRLWQKGLVEDVECSCGDPFSACPFWTAVGDRAFGGWGEVDTREALRLSRRLPLADSRLPHPFALPLIATGSISHRYQRDLVAYAGSMRRLYDGILDVSGASVVLDSMKVPAHNYMLATRPEFDARFIHLVRDPRGVAYSNTKVVARQGSREDKPMRTRRTPRETATKWLWFNLSFELLARRRRGRFLRVRYEDLVRGPLEALRACVRHAGLEPTDEDLSFLQEDSALLGAGHLVAGNRMRHETGAIRIRVDEGWRDGLAEGDRRVVEVITSPLRRRYGYRR